MKKWLLNELFCMDNWRQVGFTAAFALLVAPMLLVAGYLFGYLLHWIAPSLFPM